MAYIKYGDAWRREGEVMLEAGKVINDRYEVLNLIASGGTSKVYLVLDRHIGRILAMKAMDRKTVGSFYFARSEIEALRKVRYPLIPAIWDALYDDAYIYIVSEYVKGESLWKLCRRKGMSRARALTIANHICSALVYLHGMKEPMLYLDLKPDNIIVDREGLPHLIDFGIAGCLARRHLPAGTVGYSPPEQYMADSAMDGRADIFAFGMTYYAMRSGIPPDADPEVSLYGIQHSRVLNSTEKSFLARCCALSKEDRFADTHEVLNRIVHIRSIPDKRKKRIEIITVAAGVFITGYFFTGRIYTAYRQNEAAKTLIRQATENMKDGEYTPEGIRIIKACISSKTLSHSCEQDFIFEVARNAMLVTKDYKTAAAYFMKLDEERFPEVRDYQKLCEIQSSFDYDPEDAMTITGRVYADIVKRAPSREKYENLIFVANCFENYENDRLRGLSKAVSVLDNARRELDDPDTVRGCMEEEEIGFIRERLEELIVVKSERIKAVKFQNRYTGGKDVTEEDK